MAPIESTIASATANTVGTTNSTLRTLRIIAHARSNLTGIEDHLPLSRGIENWAPRRPERGWIFIARYLRLAEMSVGQSAPQPRDASRSTFSHTAKLTKT